MVKILLCNFSVSGIVQDDFDSNGLKIIQIQVGFFNVPNVPLKFLITFLFSLLPFFIGKLWGKP